jgi:ATP-dependent DNA helicase RecG
MEKTSQGAQLAQLDYQLRGPGERFGIQQHGRGSLKIASFADFELIARAGEAAHEIFNVPDGLDKYPLLKERVISSTISEVAPD